MEQNFHIDLMMGLINFFQPYPSSVKVFLCFTFVATTILVSFSICLLFFARNPEEKIAIVDNHLPPVKNKKNISSKSNKVYYLR